MTSFYSWMVKSPCTRTAVVQKTSAITPVIRRLDRELSLYPELPIALVILRDVNPLSTRRTSSLIVVLIIMILIFNRFTVSATLAYLASGESKEYPVLMERWISAWAFVMLVIMLKFTSLFYGDAVTDIRTLREYSQKVLLDGQSIVVQSEMFLIFRVIPYFLNPIVVAITKKA
jgi:hypothetical protein